VDDEKWNPLDHRTNDATLNSRGKPGTLAIRASAFVPRIRVRQVETRSTGSKHLVMSELGIFGELLGKHELSLLIPFSGRFRPSASSFPGCRLNLSRSHDPTIQSHFCCLHFVYIVALHPLYRNSAMTSRVRGFDGKSDEGAFSDLRLDLDGQRSLMCPVTQGIKRKGG
jgi:hypothetical protein